MNILVFSDSHHDITGMQHVLESCPPDMVIHLGDNVSDTLKLKSMFPDIPFELVCGNCDFDDIESEKNLVIENVRFFITHGHRYNVKSNYFRVIQKGRDVNADIILFGHTHKAYLRKEDRAWVVNPGSINKIYKMDRYPSYAKITIENGEIGCEIIEIK